jgi:hypothetical protein
MIRRALPVLLLLAVLAAACEEDEGPFAEDREPCAERHPLREAYFGDLHLHTRFSFDAFGYHLDVGPDEAYAFARGEAVALPPLDAQGQPTRQVRLDRALDFAMISDHSEFLGEVGLCTTPGSPGYDAGECTALRAGGENGVFIFGFETSQGDGDRLDLCGEGTPTCWRAAARERWQALQDAAEAAYDRTSACGFVTFVGYEYTNTLDVSNQHRNVIFRNHRVTDLPISFYEADSAPLLWQKLADECLDAGTGCDVMSIAHNSNLSNGMELWGTMLGVDDPAALRARAELRARVEPLVEIFQHKGAMECRNDPAAATREAECDFEQVWPDDADDCGEETGTGGMRLWGCVSRHDFVRQALLDGLALESTTGVNPFKLGITAATDTHNGTAGLVAERGFGGHVGTVDDTPGKRLGEGSTVTHDTLINNPGGLTAVWAEERSRDAIFDGLRRREVFGTTGPRIRVRLFGGWGYDAGLCASPTWLESADAGGVPMGSDLPLAPDSAGAPRFVAWAEHDPGTTERPGVELQKLQLVKGWLEADGTTREQVLDLAGDPEPLGTVDASTCEPEGPGHETLCAVWTDPDFDPELRAFYYVRVLENPTCRWSTWECLSLPASERPAAACDGSTVPLTQQERAWSSPIWYTPR